MSTISLPNKHRKSVPITIKNCAHCPKQFETKFGIYCSAKCRSAAHKEKIRKAKPALPCHFCGKAIVTKGFYRFCCPEHKVKFFHYKRGNKPLKIIINNKLVIETRKYDSVPAVIKKYTKHLEY